MQSFAFNLRRDKFKDQRVRRAFNHAFDYEWVNRTLFHEQYTRSDSYFANSEMAATGMPEGRELEILEEIRDLVPETVFTEPYVNPKTDGSGNNRANLRRAVELFEEAGWVVKDGKLANEASGERMNVEFLIDDPTFEARRRALQAIAGAARHRGAHTPCRFGAVSAPDRRAEISTLSCAASGSRHRPATRQREYWSCKAAEEEGSRNVIGICDPAIEKLIERVIFAESRADLVAAVKALDRVLLHGHYVVPQWYLATTRVAYWSRLRHPERMPPYSIGFPAIWWHDGAAPADEAP